VPVQWEAKGVDRTSGNESTILVDAEDEAQAQRRANRRGILVESVRPLDPEDSVADVPALAELAQATSPAIPYRGAPPVQPVYVQVNNPAPVRGVSGFGIAALIFGIVACFAAWVPFIGLLSVPIAAIGGLIGFVGLLVSLIGRRSGVGMPVAGLFVCGLAIGLAIFATGLVSATIAHSAAMANATNQISAPVPMASPSTPPSDSPSAAPPPAPPTDPKEAWAPATSPVVQGDASVSVSAIKIGKVPIKTIGGDTTTSDDDLLMIDVAITNKSTTHKLNYQSWAGARFSIDRDFATLQDNFGNTYKRTTFGMDKPIARADNASIYPGTPITDELVFEKPLANVQYLHLEMPAGNMGGTGRLRIEIPATMIQHPNSLGTP
jgi:hypothetical protein